MKKMQNKKGFTLMEMLIVVAIIAILVAIAIPTFSNALNKAKIATDKANIRAEYAEQMMEYMLNEEYTFEQAKTAIEGVHCEYDGATITVSGTFDAMVITYTAGDETWTFPVTAGNGG